MTISYNQYLQEYSEYLDALHYYKSVHLAMSRRKDPLKVAGKTIPGVAGVFFRTKAIPFPKTTSPIDFGSIKIDRAGQSYLHRDVVETEEVVVTPAQGDPQGDRRYRPEVTAKVIKPIPVRKFDPVPLAVASPPAPTAADDRRARRRAANKRRKARRAAAKLEQSRDASTLQAEKLKSDLLVVSLKKKAGKLATGITSKQAVVKKPVQKRISPSRKRRMERRAAIREAALPPSQPESS